MDTLLDLYSYYLISSFGQTTATGLAALSNAVSDTVRNTETVIEWGSPDTA